MNWCPQCQSYYSSDRYHACPTLQTGYQQISNSMWGQAPYNSPGPDLTEEFRRKLEEQDKELQALRKMFQEAQTQIIVLLGEITRKLNNGKV